MHKERNKFYLEITDNDGTPIRADLPVPEEDFLFIIMEDNTGVYYAEIGKRIMKDSFAAYLAPERISKIDEESKVLGIIQPQKDKVVVITSKEYILASPPKRERPKARPKLPEI